MPTVIYNSEKEAYDALGQHLDDEVNKKLKRYLKLMLKFYEDEKVTKRNKLVPTGRMFTKPGTFVGEGQYDLETQRVYNMHMAPHQTIKDRYLLEFLKGKASEYQPQVVRGTQMAWHFSSKKKLIWEVLESDFAKALAPVSLASVKENIESLKSGIQSIELSKRNAAVYSSLAGTIFMAQSMMNFYDQASWTQSKPEAIIGAVPVYSVQYLERAKSDRKLKSRAIGDVFLAHQKGNKDILRLDLTLTGIYKYIYLWYLISLQKEGGAETTNVNFTNIKEMIPSNAGLSETVNKPHKLLNYDVHRTFPIITKNHILLNMYLQTIEWHQSVEEGRGVIKVHLLFRKYFPTGAYKVFNGKTDEDGNMSGSGLELVENYGSAKRWMEFTIDAIWKMMRVYGEIYGRMMIGDDGQEVHKIDQEAMSSVNKMITSYSGKFLGIL